MEREIVWSYGGGVQTIAIMVLIWQGKLPKPAKTIMIDTGRERSLTWDYTHEIAIPILKGLGIELEIVPHSYSNVDIYSHKGTLLIPAFTEGGKLPTFCSGEWKRNAAQRYLRDQGFGPDRPIIQWLGMSLDEITRMRTSDVKWIENHYPLVFDVRLRRHECLLLIERAGLPKPPKSACWMCPNLDNEEWLEEKEQTPEDFKKAVEFEREINEQDILSGHSGVWLHESRVPLNEVDFKTRQSLPFEQICASTCWT